MSNEDAHNEFIKFQRSTSFKSWSTSEDRKGGDGTPAMFVDMTSPAYRPATGVPAAKVDAFVDMIELCGKNARGVRGNGRGNGKKWSDLATTFRLSAVYTEIKNAVRMAAESEAGPGEGTAAEAI